MNDLLENIVWHTLSGPHSKFAAGTGEARRYAQGFSQLIGFASNRRPAFGDLKGLCERGERFYVGGWSGVAPPDWQIEAESTMYQMVWQVSAPADEAPEARPLALEHAQQALELATLTRPGPFGPRTIELGEYFGLFEGGRLAAMAGERMCAGSLREVSGVCTHPDFKGRGMARRLLMKLIARQMQRGETPFLHVMSSNAHAHELYSRIGFRIQREMVVRVISPR
jgi:ribosomal protein S18 acetylase RimI-like enzyme